MRAATVNRYTHFLSIALLACGGFSAGMHHAHAGGAAPHDHGRHTHAHSDDHGHGHEHGTGVASDGGRSSDDKNFEWVATPLHEHFFLFGIELTFPIDEGTDDSPDRSQNHDLLVRIVGPNLHDSSARVAAVAQQCLPLLSSIVTVSIALAPAIHQPCMVSALPLCDSARFERSGVLRA